MDYADRLSVFLDRALSSLSRPFEQLVFLSSLRDAYTGRYLHEGWATIASEEDIHRKAKRVHTATLKTVLETPLEELCAELRDHFRSLGDNETEMVILWLDVESFREMLPSDCDRLDRDLFISQMRAALKVLLRFPRLPASLAQAASRRLPPARQFPLRQGIGNSRLKH